jgi:hypothetical protein
MEGQILKGCEVKEILIDAVGWSDLLLGVIKGKRKPADVKGDVIALKKEFNKVKYGFQSAEEAVNYAKKA